MSDEPVKKRTGWQNYDIATEEMVGAWAARSGTIPSGTASAMTAEEWRDAWISERRQHDLTLRALQDTEIVLGNYESDYPPEREDLSPKSRGWYVNAARKIARKGLGLNG